MRYGLTLLHAHSERRSACNRSFTQVIRAYLNAEIVGDSGGLSNWGAKCGDMVRLSIALILRTSCAYRFPFC